MRAIELSTLIGDPGDLITVLEHSVPGDGGGGTFIWSTMPDPTAMPAEDGGMSRRNANRLLELARHAITKGAAMLLASCRGSASSREEASTFPSRSPGKAKNGSS